MTQAQFKLQYDEYVIYMSSKNIHVFALDIRPLHPWITRTFNIDCHDWKQTEQITTDFYGHKFAVWEVAGHKFINNHISDIILTTPTQKTTVKGCNSHYNRSPRSFKDDSFYNQYGDLIFYVDEEQKENLTRELEENTREAREWEAYNEVKDKVNTKTWTEINETVAMYFLEAVPPIRMRSGNEFMVGEASGQIGGVYYYKHCLKYKGKWYAKLSSIDQYEQNNTIVIDCKSE